MFTVPAFGLEPLNSVHFNNKNERIYRGNKLIYETSKAFDRTMSNKLKL